MRTPPRLHAADTLGGKGAVADEKLGVLGAVDVVGDYAHRVALAQLLAELEAKHGFSGADRAADADARGTIHEMKIREELSMENTEGTEIGRTEV
jgi:hypothetical protein